jgi:hypothetical protein
VFCQELQSLLIYVIRPIPSLLSKWEPRALSLGIKRPKREDDHSPPSEIEVKNALSSTCVPSQVFMVLCIIKHDFTFTFTMFN